MPSQKKVRRNKRCHRFHHRYDTGAKAYVVAAGRGNFRFFAAQVYGFLHGPDGRHRFDGRPEADFCAGGNTAERSARVVFPERECAAGNADGIVAFRAGHARAGKSRAEFNPFYRADGKYCLSQQRFKFIKHRFSQSGRYAGNPRTDNASGRIAFRPQRFNGFLHFRGSRLVRRAHRVGFDFFRIPAGAGNAGRFLCPCLYENVFLRQKSPGHRSGCHPACCFPAGSPSSAAEIPQPVFLPVCKIRVPRPEFFLQSPVILRPLGRVAD